ncbi:hypothetical protein BRE01_29620 [Brevibacillus reuszeri]|uniref:Uncharacterized protein n=1 Tax=Brevibacillus reuszeri TaxID=54915 RepID=A0A0K9YKM4_9BACL|nr:hypothetical protein ADS79_32815 [Brevibacillus reuszeri]GED69260.1 hypothetical protein BRE01_29620 [Brevibacillus reuszeri]
MSKNNILQNVLGFIVCFLLFVGSMLFTNFYPLLILVGILGFAGLSFFVYRIISFYNKKG